MDVFKMSENSKLLKERKTKKEKIYSLMKLNKWNYWNNLPYNKSNVKIS